MLCPFGRRGLISSGRRQKGRHVADRPAECRVCDQNWGEGARTWDPPGWPARERRRQGVSRRSDHLCRCLLPTQRPGWQALPRRGRGPLPRCPPPRVGARAGRTHPPAEKSPPRSPPSDGGTPPWGWWQQGAQHSPARGCGAWSHPCHEARGWGGGREAHRSVQAGWGLPLPPPVRRPLPRSKSEKQNAGASEPRPHRNRAAISCRRGKQPCHPQQRVINQGLSPLTFVNLFTCLRTAEGLRTAVTKSGQSPGPRGVRSS